jgi:Lrp/AsnC family leucine-responsive transcriptional regulator
MAELDRTDLRMLAVLQAEGRITNAELAERISLSPSACLRRLQRLESEKVISGYAAQIDPQAVGLGLQAFVRVQLARHEGAEIERFVQRLAAWDEVVACHALTGC